MLRHALVVLALLGPLAACASVAAPEAPPELAAIEAETGGRLGVALVDASGALLAGHRTDERFAMCSTFKLALAGAILERVDTGEMALAAELPYDRDDLVFYSPVVEKSLDEGRVMTVEEMAVAIVQVSDNAAANLLMGEIGGPDGWTEFVRRHGDRVSRLDRWEPALNENAPGDPRDTTSPAAMARLTRDLVLGDALAAESRDRLAAWAAGTTTGAGRIPAGLPDGWRHGHKTGTCGTAYNDVAVVWPPDGPPFVLAVYLDRPDVERPQAEAAIADVAQWAVDWR
jgi:beta-lactamase class A